MEKKLCLTLFLVPLLCPNVNTELQLSCPYRCQCFTTSQVLCADERMTSLPSNMSKQVKDFIVMTSSVAYLFPNTLEDSPQLTKLVFLNNALRSIHSQAFQHMTELQELEISGNPWLDNLILGTFSNQTNMTILILNYNRFKTVLPGMFDSLKQLETLQMKGNIISHLPDFLFQDLQNLHVLDLSQNQIKVVRRDMFSGLAELEVLKINNNLISNLTLDTFHNISQLTELHLEGNSISELHEGIFSELTNLNVLNLRGNLLTTFSDGVFGFNNSNLTELNLKGNRLTEVSWLSSLTSLTDLILSSNQLSNLHQDTFRNLTMLENLDLSENQLTFLPEQIFNNLSAIQTIYLQMNNLRRVEPKLFEDQLLIQQLHLSNNQLETLPTGIFDPFVLQHTLRIHGNPWKCDCHMWYLHDWLLRKSQNIEMLDSVLCESPGFLRRRTVVSIDKNQMVCTVSGEKMPEHSRCSLQSSDNNTIIVCKVDKCSPLTVKVQFQEDDDNIHEHVYKHEPELSQCGKREPH